MRIASFLVVAASLSVLAACTQKQVYRNIYEAIRTKNGLQSAPHEHLGKPEAPDYSGYDLQRNERLKPAGKTPDADER